MSSKYQQVPDFTLCSVKRYAWAGDGKETARKKELEVPNPSLDHQTTIEGSSFEDVKGLKLTNAFQSVLHLKNATEKCHSIIYIKI